MAKAHRYPFTYDAVFEGAGWEKIRELASTHSHFLIGEDHGLAEVPLFTKELVKQVPYDLFVTEIDSITASIAKMVSSQSSSQIKSFHADHPSALSFYSAREEFDLLQELAKTDTEIWGLDQVSLLSTGIVLQQLSEICRSEEAKTLTMEMATLSDQRFTEATRTGNYDTLFIYSAEQKDFDRLREALQGESPEAISILNDLETSWKIYNRVDDANYRTRITGMKSKLLNYYTAQPEGQSYQKVLYKFGAYHISRSESIVGGFDVGNFVSNIAEAEGASSYHLLTVGKKGNMNSFLLAEGMQSAPYNITDEGSPLHELLPFAELVSDGEWAFFDLQPLRSQMKGGKMEVASPFLRKVLDGYDGLVIIPETVASSHY